MNWNRFSRIPSALNWISLGPKCVSVTLHALLANFLLANFYWISMTSSDFFIWPQTYFYWLGAKLIGAVAAGTMVVLQMPRGNLEAIHPRALTLNLLKHLINGWGICVYQNVPPFLVFFYICVFLTRVLFAVRTLAGDQTQVFYICYLV